jgi:hypothetical protein
VDPDFEARANALVAQSDGRIWIESGDRDTETQTRLWNEAVAKYGEEEARDWVAPPGYSFHEKGQAIDFGGDMKLLAQLAPQFGLWQPMSWEEWHWEPIGSRDGTESPLSMSEKPVNPSALLRQTKTRDYGDVMAQLLNLKPFRQRPETPADITFNSPVEPGIALNPGFLTPELMTILAPGPNIRVPGRGGAAAPNSVSNNPTLDRFMAALRDVESSGNYQAEGVPTPWGTATGAYQYLDGTWDGYMGYARAMDAPPEIQDQKAREDMQRYYDEYGSWDDVAAAWYSGPGGNWQSGEVQEYVGKVNSRL